MTRNGAIYRLLLLLLLVGVGCGAAAEGGSNGAGKADATLTLAAYTTPREAYARIIPLFQEHWLEQTGHVVSFETSYLGSGAQSRAIVEGFEADIAALSLEADITRIEDAGLITHDWRALPNKGIVTTSVVAFAVRPGNPQGIEDWHDLARPGLQILTPNPKTSGGAMWNILSLYGAAQRGFVAGYEASDEGAQAFMLAVLRNVTVMDKGARESITNFEQGVGDLAITYENEILVAQKGGQEQEMVLPRSSILIENPVAVIDANARRHGTEEVAEAFVRFLFTAEAQRIFAEYGLRAVDPDVAVATAAEYPPLDDVFTIEAFGGWPQAIAHYFSDEGVYTITAAQAQGAGP